MKLTLNDIDACCHNTTWKCPIVCESRGSEPTCPN